MLQIYSFLNNGEICLTNERVYVQQSIFDVFLKKFVEHVKTWKVGYPDQESTKVGPQSSRVHFEKVTKCLDRAIQQGAKVQLGYGHPDYQKFGEKGYFVAPTILTGTDHSFEISLDACQWTVSLLE